VHHTGSNDEQRLAELIRRGDNAAMREFCSLYVPHLKAVCTRYVTDSEDASDVLQETLISIVTHISDFHYLGQGSLKAWATRIAVNESLNYIRRNRRHDLTLQEQYIDDIAEEEEEDPPIEDIPPEVIQQMVRQLPTGYRTVFNLYVFEDKSHQEIAQLLGTSVKTSISQLHKAKNLLAQMIQTYHDNKRNAR
jgi:RNA polymerase sigma-70 factor (ECF subfamily)